MIKIHYLLHFLVVFIYCRYVAEYIGNDVGIYILSVVVCIGMLVRYDLMWKEFVAHFLFVQGLTLWACYFFLDQQYQLVTHALRFVKGLLLGLFLVLEIAAGMHIIKRYLFSRRHGGMFASDAFVFAIDPYPLLPEMKKLFIVEFNIWRALLLRAGLYSEHDGRGLKALARINTGYRPRHLQVALTGLLSVNILCMWLTYGVWLAIPLVSTLYVALVINCDTLLLKRHAIYDDGKVLKIPNGIYGFVSVEKANIESIVRCGPDEKCDFSVSRIIPCNLLMHLAAPIIIFGRQVTMLGVCVDDSALLCDEVGRAYMFARS